MTEYVRVPREPTDEMHHAGQELMETHNASDIYRAMLAASPQGEGSSADADTHRGAVGDVVGLFDQISALCTSFNCQAHDADDVLGQINQLAYAGIAAVKPASVRTGQ